MTDEIVTLAEIVGLAVALVAMALVVFLVGRAIMAAAKYAPGSQLVVVLALLAVLSIMAALSSGDLAGDFITLAATAIGALSAALTTWYQAQRRGDGPQDAQDGPGAPLDSETTQDPEGTDDGR